MRLAAGFCSLIISFCLSSVADTIGGEIDHGVIIRQATSLKKHTGNPVLGPGRLGEWDDKGCGCFSVADVKGRLHLYYMASGTQNSWRIGLATSDNGINWQRSPANPVLSPGLPGSWDNRAVSMPYVLNDAGQLSMIYSGAGRGGGFGLARSTDGVSWERHGNAPVMRGVGGSMDPCLRKIGDEYVLWYVGQQSKSFRIFQATSEDGIVWKKNPQPILPLGKEGRYDETSHAGPVVLHIGSRYYMFHLGGSSRGWQIGLAHSSDGVTWTKCAANPILDAGEEDAWDSGSTLSLDVRYMNGRFHLWYAASRREVSDKPEKDQAIRIGYAVSPGPQEQTQLTSSTPAANSPLDVPVDLPLAVAPMPAERVADVRKAWSDRIQHPVELENSIGMKLSLIPPGDFTMGRTEQQFDELLDIIRRDPKMKQNEGGMIAWSMLMMPAHRVRITKPFYMGATEVTVEQFRQFVKNTGYRTEAEQGLNHGKPYKGGRAMSTWQKPMAWRTTPLKQKDDEPVLHLCWNDCVEFCRWLSEKEGREYRLPTEAEWEYGCRAGTVTPWHFGTYSDVDKVAHEYAWWSDGTQAKHQLPRAAGLGKPNAFGLYDMHGNVWEYVGDWWHRLSYKEMPLNDPTGPAQQSEKNDQRRIIRGSSFDWGRWGGDSAYRMRITQRSNQHPHMGFRVAMTIRDAISVAPAVDPDRQRRATTRDPGADSAVVQAALKDSAKPDDCPDALTVKVDDVSIEFVLIPAGSFLMGSTKGPGDERPVHRTVISRPFYMARHEITEQQWEAVMGPHPRLVNWRKEPNELTGPRRAMRGVSWSDCRRFMATLKEKVPDHTFALPTEAQWEYACRAGSDSEFSFGNDESQLEDYALFAGNKEWPGKDGKFRYHDVSTGKSNAWGLHDMHGGVWEWCTDRYDADYYFSSPLVDPGGPASGRFRVLRGGSWFRDGRYARSAYRRFFHPSADGDGVTAWILDFGFRPVINAKL
ncbi:MAG: SUMF1/EgtB/PvdO family nonheme iron enzyme [Fuerstiella sp.]